MGKKQKRQQKSARRENHRRRLQSHRDQLRKISSGEARDKELEQQLNRAILYSKTSTDPKR